MPDRGSVIIRLVARVRALLPTHWFGSAGQQFRRTAEACSEFAEAKNLKLSDIAEEAVVLGRRKLQGLAHKEYATALKEFGESEKIAIETELQKRAMESKVRQEEAAARKSEADADLAEVELMCARMKLVQEMQAIGVVVRRDEQGNLEVLPAPENCDLEEFIRRYFTEKSDRNKLTE